MSYAFGTMYKTTRVCSYHGYFSIGINIGSSNLVLFLVVSMAIG